MFLIGGKVLELVFLILHPMNLPTAFLIIWVKGLGKVSFDEEPVEVALERSSRTLWVVRKEGQSS